MSTKSFTIKLPIDLLDRIEERRFLAKRSRVKEIMALLVIALDYLDKDAKEARGLAISSLGPNQTPASQTETDDSSSS